MQFLVKITVLLISLFEFSIIMVISCPLKSDNIPENPVYFILYTRKNEFSPYTVNSSKQLANFEHFDKSHQSIIFINENYDCMVENSVDTKMKEAYLKKGEYNFISIDWSKYGNSHRLANQVYEKIGERIAQFLHEMHESQAISLPQLKVIGFGRGAHIAADASRFLQNCGLPKIGRITGLNPLDYLSKKPMDRVNYLNKSSAAYVDLIFTASDSPFQTNIPIGHVDFYVNDASNHDICGIDMCCEFNYAWIWYIETVNDPHKYPVQKCEFQPPKRECTEVAGQYMGIDSNSAQPGVFHVKIVQSSTRPKSKVHDLSRI